MTEELLELVEMEIRGLFFYEYDGDNGQLFKDLSLVN
jgi:translation elongation factor EF-Tu-like GTPase